MVFAFGGVQYAVIKNIRCFQAFGGDQLAPVFAQVRQGHRALIRVIMNVNAGGEGAPPRMGRNGQVGDLVAGNGHPEGTVVDNLIVKHLDLITGKNNHPTTRRDHRHRVAVLENCKIFVIIGFDQVVIYFGS
ncbi:hypothetical protein D9M70_571480 [compost metagenome]